MERTLIIAEIGVNHEGRLDKAIELISVAKQSGADAAKLQCFTPWRLCPTDYARQAMLKGLALTESELRMCASETRRFGMEFMVTPMDEEWLRFCVDELHVKRVKVGSGQNRSVGFLKHVGDVCMERGLPIILSNGMSDDEQIHKAVHCLTPDGGVGRVTVLYCVSQYPTPEHAIDLSLMNALRKHGCGGVGFSSHCPSFWPSVAAVYAGASVIEQHLALPGCVSPDASSSLLPDAFAAMVREIRAAEAARV